MVKLWKKCEAQRWPVSQTWTTNEKGIRKQDPELRVMCGDVVPLTPCLSSPPSVGDGDLPPPPPRAEAGGQHHRQRAEENQPERSCLVCGLIHHGQALLPLVKCQAWTGGGPWTLSRQVSQRHTDTRTAPVYSCVDQVSPYDNRFPHLLVKYWVFFKSLTVGKLS